MTNHTNWTGDLTEGATIFVATPDGQLSKCRVESVRDRHFSVEGIEREFDKLNACSVDGLLHSYPDDFESRELFGLCQQKTGSSLCKLIHYRYSKSSTCWLAWNLPGRDMDTSTEAAKP